ncbi:hypothetical protein MICAB_690002 [Microcystis aeruginosa PCC 9717]|uniref:Uncharacterized protein n=1 Tax=Microcystis aeruginosa PCC 9717 TaxID=1160286 RepID=I4FW55_MICAE|nr:hypothetical protein MICAB_690002 [Microcystis aeruginosa PCC 9717]
MLNLILNLLGSNFGNKSKNIQEYQESPQLNYWVLRYLVWFDRGA